MAKSAKRPAKKTAPKAGKKTSNRAPKKSLKKTPKKAAKKVARKDPKNPKRKAGKRFLIIYHAPLDAMAQTANMTAEQRAVGMALWKAWAGRAGSRIYDLGAPLINGKSLNPTGTTAASSKEVAGYSMLDAEDLNEVLNLLEGHPHLTGWHPQATIEIHETMLMPDM